MKTNWKPIEQSLQYKGSKKMFVVIAINVSNGFTGGKPYTTDPYCVWYEKDGSFARWPHNFNPTHCYFLPEIKE